MKGLVLGLVDATGLAFRMFRHLGCGASRSGKVQIEGTTCCQ